MIRLGKGNAGVWRSFWANSNFLFLDSNDGYECLFYKTHVKMYTFAYIFKYVIFCNNKNGG